METRLESLPQDIFPTYPSVYAVHDQYQILVPVTKETIMWAEVDGECYYDDFCGIPRSDVTTHRMVVPLEALNRTRTYSICYRIVYERLPYFPKTSEVFKVTFGFRPVQDKPNLKIFHIADAHNRIDSPIAAAKYYAKDLDLLILNGDVPEDSSNTNNYLTIHQIVGQVTKGEIPTVFSRGNHDLRGKFAEKMGEHTPIYNNRTYYTFRVGPIWGIVLDCAEDKLDSSEEYGNINFCHHFRVEQTDFIKNVIKNADEEYQAPGVKYRLLIAHVPFSYIQPPPFDIEQDLYREWCRLLSTHVHPQLFIAGHMHDLYITMPGDPKDDLGQPCPVIVGTTPGKTKEEYTGTAIELAGDKATVRFVNQDRTVLGETVLDI